MLTVRLDIVRFSTKGSLLRSLESGNTCPKLMLSWSKACWQSFIHLNIFLPFSELKKGTYLSVALDINRLSTVAHLISSKDYLGDGEGLIWPLLVPYACIHHNSITWPRHVLILVYGRNPLMGQKFYHEVVDRCHYLKSMQYWPFEHYVIRDRSLDNHELHYLCGLPIPF